MIKHILLLALLTAFPPLTTDMYLPAIPLLQDTWQQPLTMVNLTLIGFFAAYCFFILIYGPLSDRFGRRTPLMIGIAIYILASLMCALSQNVGSLIVCRILQGAGAAAASTISMAICKDIFEGRERQQVLAYIVTIMALAPMLAPVIGSWLLLKFTWPWIFLTQGMLGIIALAGVFCMKEPLKKKSVTGASQLVGTYLRVVKNRSYLSFTFMLAICAFPFFAFIGGSADIYITRFGLSEQSFGYFFAFNAVALMLGSLASSWVARRLSVRSVMIVGYAGMLVGSLWMLLSSHHGPWNLALPMFVITFFVGLSRPAINNMALEQVKRDIGAASSFLVFSFFVCGSIAMWLISIDWPDKLNVLGILGVMTAVLTLILLFVQYNNTRRSPLETRR